MTGDTNTSFNHLWNDMPFEERKRLMPHSIEVHILHLEQAKAVAVRAHRRHMNELNDWIANLKESLKKEAAGV